jgi:sec-independent protein translocase protein TatA
MGEVGKGITSFKKGVSEGNKELDEAKDEDESETAHKDSVRDVTPKDEKDKV